MGVLPFTLIGPITPVTPITQLRRTVNGLLRTAILLRAATLEVAILASHLLFYPTGVFSERLGQGYPAPVPGARRTGEAGEVDDADGTAGPAQPPVLLLHGFIDNSSVFGVLGRSLRRNGWEHVQALNYSPLTWDVRHAANVLGAHIEQVCESTGQEQVDIVGHSLGGLIGRYYAQRLGGDARVRTLVTLGTPHAGTRAIALASTHPIIRQIRPNSELIAELALPASGCRTRFVSFWSPLDELMAPVENARLDHPDLIVRNVEVRGIGHLAMPVNGDVVTGIREALRDSENLTGAVDAA